MVALRAKSGNYRYFFRLPRGNRSRMLSLKGAAPFLSRALGFTIPLLLALHWPVIACHVNAVIMLAALRAGLLGSSLLLLLLWSWNGNQSLGTKVGVGPRRVFSLVYLVSALCGTNISRGLQDWVRVATAMFAGFGVVRALRHPATAKAFGISLILASLISCALVLFVYWHYMGFRTPGYESLRIFKESALRGSGVALNPLASAAFLFCLMGMCILPPSWILRSIGGIRSGCRRRVNGFQGTGRIARCLRGGAAVPQVRLEAGTSTYRVAAWGSLLLGTVVITGLLSQATPYKISDATEGRYDVWTVGWAKFLERPALGYGPDSWRDDLFSRLPGYYKETGALQKLKAGGYHSEYVTLLAEGGLLCFLSALTFLGLLLRDSLRMAFHTETRHYRGEFIAFTCLFLCVRALIEIPGLFGYGQDVTDYLAYLFVALVASRMSLLERPTRFALASGRTIFPRMSVAALRTGTS